jgi:carbamoyl-phosphate synthase large subunit
MTGAGAPGAAGIIHCLKQDPSISLTVADANPNAIGKHLTDDFVNIPPASDKHFIDALLEICAAKKIQALLPLVTRELLPLANAMEKFKETGTVVLVSPAASIEIANDKGKLYQFLEWRGIDVPQYHIAENIEQFKNAVASLGYPGTTVCFKPCISNGSRGFRIIDPSINEAALLFNEKPGHTFITYDDAVRILASTNFPELLISEFLPGEEYSVDCIADNGRTIIAIPRTRIKMIQGISVEGQFVYEETIIAYCEKIIHELQLHGNIGLQVKRASNGKFLLLEINPRVQGTIAAALGAGVNLPLIAIQHAVGKPIDPSALCIKWGTKFSRHWQEVFY